MDYRYNKYQIKKFKKWKDKVKIYLPHIAIAFYKSKLEGRHIPVEKENLLGKVITYINDHYYSLLNREHNPSNELERLSAEICLEILVTELFSYIRKENILDLKELKCNILSIDCV